MLFGRRSNDVGTSVHSLGRRKGGYAHTTDVLRFAGMNGKPTGGFLFSHVSCFSGCDKIGRKPRGGQEKGQGGEGRANRYNSGLEFAKSRGVDRRGGG